MQRVNLDTRTYLTARGGNVNKKERQLYSHLYLNMFELLFFIHFINHNIILVQKYPDFILQLENICLYD